MTSIEATRCPLCGDENLCAAERGESTCWCYTTTIPQSLLARLPENARGVACICEKCVRAERARLAAND